MFSWPHSISQSLLMDIYQCNKHSCPENSVLKDKHFFRQNSSLPCCDLPICIFCPFSIGFVVFSLLIFRNLLQITDTNPLVCFFFFLGYIGSLLLHVGFLQLWRVGATLHCGARASHCSGFSCCGAWALGAWASVVAAHRLSSRGVRASVVVARGPQIARASVVVACGLQQLWRTGLVAPQNAGSSRTRARTRIPCIGGFLTTVPPGKSLNPLFITYIAKIFSQPVGCLLTLFMMTLPYRSFSFLCDKTNYKQFRKYCHGSNAFQALSHTASAARGHIAVLSRFLW